MAMSMSVCMGFKRTHFHLIYLTYLIWVISLFAQQQGNPCGSGVCGLNGICRVSGSTRNCSCPPGFHFVVNDNPSKGCQQDTFPHQSCSASGAKMHTIEHVDFFENDYVSLEFTNATACKQACLDDCFCTVAVYNDITGYGEHCWMKSLPMKNGAENINTTAFVKVYDAVPPTLSKQRKEEKGKWLIIVGISLVGCSFVFGAILLLIWLYTCRPKLKALQDDHNANPVGLKGYSYQEIDTETGGFKQEIGRGAFGKVYKGVLSDGREIAVKKLDDLLMQGGQEDREKEFRTEMGVFKWMAPPSLPFMPNTLSRSGFPEVKRSRTSSYSGTSASAEPREWIS
ncbi:hypothetical protein SUGI_0715910 [Cryptomeria japonica]|nr:hypothetical protein SUGI_0715910 [Cryptomeria japonica]